MKNKSKIEEMREKTQLKKHNLAKLEKQKLGLNQIIKPCLFLVISIVLEIIAFCIFDFKTASGAKQIFPTYILFDVGLWLVICALILCISKNWLSNLIFYFSVIVEVIIFLVNVTLRGDFGYLFTFDMVKLIPGAFESMDLSFLNFKLIAIAIVGIAALIAAPLLLDKFLKNKKIQIKKISRPIFCLLLFLITATVGAGCYTAQTTLLKTSSAYKEISDDDYLYSNQQIYDQAYQKFGSCGFYLKNLTNWLFKNNGVSKSEIDEIIKEYENSVNEKDTSATLYGDNLIVVMLESFEWFAIDPYNTPNLWALKTGETNENVNTGATIFTNYVSNNKTNISENLCMLGYMPSDNIFSVKSQNVYATKYSLPNLLKNEGYTTSFFHNWNIDFYNRKTSNTNIGFDNIYSLEDFESETKSTKFNYYNLESDFIEQFMEQIAPTTDGKKFMSFYTTVSSHGTYDITNPLFEEYYKTYDTNLKNYKSWLEGEKYHYPTSEYMQGVLREYKAAAMDTDEMIGKLFAHLKQNNMLNSTTVVIYADHNAYYQQLTNDVKCTNIDDYASQTAYTVPLMIYTNGRLETNKVDDFCSPYDLYPTLCELMGLPYNTINAQGKNILSAGISETVYMSHLTGFYSDKCHSKNMIYITLYDGSTSEDADKFKTNVCKLLEKQHKLNIIYRSNRTY